MYEHVIGYSPLKTAGAVMHCILFPPPPLQPTNQPSISNGLEAWSSPTPPTLGFNASMKNVFTVRFIHEFQSVGRADSADSTRFFCLSLTRPALTAHRKHALMSLNGRTVLKIKTPDMSTKEPSWPICCFYESLFQHQ